MCPLAPEPSQFTFCQFLGCNFTFTWKLHFYQNVCLGNVLWEVPGEVWVCKGGKYENKWLLSFSGFGQVIVSFVCLGIALGEEGHRVGEAWIYVLSALLLHFFGRLISGSCRVCIQAQRLGSKSAAKIIKEQAAEITFSIIIILANRCQIIYMLVSKPR